MRWINGRSIRVPGNCGPAMWCIVLALAVASLLSTQGERLVPSSTRAANAGKQMTVYTPQQAYTVVIHERGGKEYVSLLGLLQSLGRTELSASAQAWKLRVNEVLGEFEFGKSKARIGGKSVDLGERILEESGRALLPVRSVARVVSAYTGTGVSYISESRRLLVDRQQIGTTAELKKGDPSSLALGFQQAVSPAIHTDGSRIRLVFQREPLLFGADRYSFEDKLFSQVQYSESEGKAELTILASAPIIASVGSDGKTITISAAPSVVAKAEQPVVAARETASIPPTETTPSGEPDTAATGGQAQTRRPIPTASQWELVLDPSHGGDERGALLSETLAEKDVVLAFAKKLHAELRNRGISALMLRDDDSTVSPERRIAAANGSRAPIYVALHADRSGSGIRVFAPLVPQASQRRGIFLPWDSAQDPFTEQSKTLAGSLFAEIGKRQLAGMMRLAPVRPLASIAMPALAIEIAPEGGSVETLADQAYQQRIAVALAESIAAIRDKDGKSAGGMH